MSWAHSAQELARERERMLSPMLWPMWPWLPVKRRGQEGIECGRIWADDTIEGQPVTVYRWPDEAPPEDRIIKKYTDVDAVLDDGWVID